MEKMIEFRIIQELIVATEDLAKLDYREGLENNAFASWAIVKNRMMELFPETFNKFEKAIRADFLTHYNLIYNSYKKKGKQNY